MPLHEAQMAEHNVLRPYVANPIIFHRQQWHLREKGKEKRKFFLTRNWFISHYIHFKRTGRSWFQQSLTKPHTFKGCEFWGGILIPPTAMGCALLATVQCQSRNRDIQSSTEKTSCHILNFALITNALAVYSGTFASLLLGTRDLHAFPL